MPRFVVLGSGLYLGGGQGAILEPFFPLYCRPDSKNLEHQLPYINRSVALTWVILQSHRAEKMRTNGIFLFLL
jgi:hypothetical protein